MINIILYKASLNVIYFYHNDNLHYINGFNEVFNSTYSSTDWMRKLTKIEQVYHIEKIKAIKKFIS